MSSAEEELPGPEEPRPADWVERKLTGLRENLNSEEWAMAMARLRADLASQRPVSREANEEMLSLVVNDALEGIDISQRYPLFYRSLLAEADLRQQFIDALEILIESEAGELGNLPAVVADLRFLWDEDTAGEQEQVDPPPATKAVRLTWQRTREQLRALFAQLGPPRLAESGPVYRGAEAPAVYGEEGAIPLLEDEVEAAGALLAVQLLALQPEADPEHLILRLTVRRPEQEPGAPLPEMPARIIWGGYRARVTTDADGRATFPPLPLQDIMDATGMQVGSALALTVETG